LSTETTFSVPAELPIALLKTSLYDLHVALGARMVSFAGYAMPVQYPSGLVAEHHHTRSHAGLFDVSHMGQLRLVGKDAAAAFETLMPVDVIDLAVGKQRYGLLTNEAGGIIDDLMFFKVTDDEIFVIVNGACKAGDIAHIEKHIGSRCQVITMPTHGLLALQGPQAVKVMSRLATSPTQSIEKLVFMTGGRFTIAGADCFVTRSGYTGEDGFEISVSAEQTEMLAKALLAEPEVKPIGLGARNSLRLEAGLCLYGQDIDVTTNPVEAGLGWAMQKVRRAEGARAGGYIGATNIIAAQAINTPASVQNDSKNGQFPAKSMKKRVGLVALDRVPVREHTELQDASGKRIGEVTSGLLAPTIDKPIAMGYVSAEFAVVGTRINAMVRGKVVAMEVAAMPFVPNRYFRG
jgi:aminomethyltransferase